MNRVPFLIPSLTDSQDVATEAPVPMSPLERWLEYAAVLLWMLVTTSVVHTVLSPHIAENDLRRMSTAVNLPVAAFNALADLVLLLLILPRLGRLKNVLLQVKPLLLFALLTVASTFWSLNPELTLRRGIYFVLTMIASCYFGERYTVGELGRILAGAVVSLMLLSGLVYFFNPSFVLDVSHPGDWMGLSEHKNVFGQFVAFGLVALLFVDLHSWRRMRLPLLALSLLMLFLSHSATGWMVAAILLLLLPALSLMQRARGLVWPFLLLLCLTGAVIYALTGAWTATALQMLGKDPTLSGRTELWNSLLLVIQERPLLGYGYEAFFSDFGRVLTLQTHLTWLPPNAHNGYLQIAVGTGLLGMALTLWMIVMYLTAAIRFAQREGSRESLLPLAAGIFWLIYSSVEVALMQGQTLLPFLIFALFASLKSRESVSDPLPAVSYAPLQAPTLRGALPVLLAPASRLELLEAGE